MNIVLTRVLFLNIQNTGWAAATNFLHESLLSSNSALKIETSSLLGLLVIWSS